MPDGRDEKPSPLSESLIGSWELLSREDHTSSGERRIDASLGENPVALLIYDRRGHFAAQFMKRDRDLALDADAPSGAPNNSQARGGCDAYFGTTRSTMRAVRSRKR